MYFGKILLLCVASAFSIYDSATNHVTAASVVISTAATHDVSPTSTEVDTVASTEIVTAISDVITSITSSKFFMWRGFFFYVIVFLKVAFPNIFC